MVVMYSSNFEFPQQPEEVGVTVQFVNRGHGSEEPRARNKLNQRGRLALKFAHLTSYIIS